MRIDFTSEERLLILTALGREAHEQEEFASAPGIMGTPSAAVFTARAAAARALLAKLETAAIGSFKASLELAGADGAGPCGGCGGDVHRVVDGERAWVECTHGCGWSTKAPR